MIFYMMVGTNDLDCAVEFYDKNKRAPKTAKLDLHECLNLYFTKKAVDN